MSAAEAFAIPDVIEPITAWRAWALAEASDGAPELRPIIYSGETWPAGEVAQAKCPPHAASGHRPPEADCSCGLYAVDGLDRLPAVTGRDVTVIGSVALWGTIVEHDSGFRAERAYPTTLRLVCGPCWEAGVFSPEVRGTTRTARGTLLALCERHARGAVGSEPEPAMLERRLLLSYAVERVSEGSVQAVSTAWHHPERRPRQPLRRRMSLTTVAMAALFFAALIGLYALAVAVR
jgi:hypothetical protein